MFVYILPWKTLVTSSVPFVCFLNIIFFRICATLKILQGLFLISKPSWKEMPFKQKSPLPLRSVTAGFVCYHSSFLPRLPFHSPHSKTILLKKNSNFIIIRSATTTTTTTTPQQCCHRFLLYTYFHSRILWTLAKIMALHFYSTTLYPKLCCSAKHILLTFFERKIFWDSIN